MTMVDHALVASRQRPLEMYLAGVLAVGLVLIFWSEQRSPALLKRLHAGTTVKVAGADPLSIYSWTALAQQLGRKTSLRLAGLAALWACT